MGVSVSAGDHPIKYLRLLRKYTDFKCPYQDDFCLRSSELPSLFEPSIFRDKKRRQKFMISGQSGSSPAESECSPAFALRQGQIATARNRVVLNRVLG